MNKLPLLAAAFLAAAPALAAGPSRIAEPGAAEVKLDLARPAAALPGVTAAAAPPDAASSAASLETPASVVPAAVAPAAAESPAAPDASADRAAQDAKFDGSAEPGAVEDALTPEVDFGQAVSQRHRDLLREALSAHADALEGFFFLTGRPRPGFLYVSAAHDDSPGAATVVTRVIYTMSGHSSRFDERVADHFWIGLDLKTKKIEFFTKEPLTAAAPVSPDVVDAVKLRFASLDVRGLLDAMGWKHEAPALGEHAVVSLNEREPGSGDEYAYSALIPAGQGDMVFYVRRSGGLAGQTVYAGPIAVSQRAVKLRLHAVLAEEDKALAGRITTGIALQVLVRASTPGDLAAAKAIVSRRLPGLEPLFKFEVVTGRIVAQAAAEPARSGALWTRAQLERFVNAHPALPGVPGVRSIKVADDSGRVQLVVELEPGVTEAEGRAALEKAVPDVRRLYGVMGAPSQLRLVAAAAPAQSKTPGVSSPDWFGTPAFKQAGFFGSSGAYALYLDENGARMRIDSPRPGSPVTLRFSKKDGSSHVARVIDGSEALALSSMLGSVEGRIVLADSTRDAVIALRESLRRVFTGAAK